MMTRINLTVKEEILCIVLIKKYIRDFIGHQEQFNDYTIQNIASGSSLIAKLSDRPVHNNPKLRKVGFYDTHKQLPLFDKKLS